MTDIDEGEDYVDNADYYPADFAEKPGGYDRLVKHIQQAEEYAIIHGTDDEDHYCMDHDCETWNNPEEIALHEAALLLEQVETGAYG